MIEKQIVYKVIKPGCPDYGLHLVYVRTMPDGQIVLMAGRPWRKVPMAFKPDEVERTN